MNYQSILKRSWNMVWRYRALWLFGAILALTTINGVYGVLDPSWEHHGKRIPIKLSEKATIYIPGEGLSIDLTDPDWLELGISDADRRAIHEFFSGESVAEEIVRGVSSILIALGVIAAGTAILGLVVRYVSEAALIRMVHEGEETGEKSGILRGFRLGFSRSAWRLFAIDLVIGLPLLVLFLLGLGLAVLPLLLWAVGSTTAGVTGIALSAGGFFLLSILSLMVGAIVSPFVQMMRRACAVEGLGVMASIGRGFGMVRRHVKEVLVIWVIWMGTRIGWMAASIPVLIVISPLLLVSVVAGAVAGAVPALMVGGLLTPVLAGPFPWIVGALAGMPLFILVLLAPVLFFAGLVEIFKSSTWTLAYRDLCALEHTATEKVPASPGASLEPAPAG